VSKCSLCVSEERERGRISMPRGGAVRGSCTWWGVHVRGLLLGTAKKDQLQCGDPNAQPPFIGCPGWQGVPPSDGHKYTSARHKSLSVSPFRSLRFFCSHTNVVQHTHTHHITHTILYTKLPHSLSLTHSLLVVCLHLFSTPNIPVNRPSLSFLLFLLLLLLLLLSLLSSL